MKKQQASLAEMSTIPDDGDARFPGFAAVALTIVATVSLFLFARWYPIHDSMNWFPFFDYFQRAIIEGSVPYWNPYSKLGMPFFQNVQPLGMLDPTILLTSLLHFIKSLGVLDIHVIRIFVRFFVFIAGTYWTLKLLTDNNKLSAILAVVLFFGLLPSFLRQSGMVDNNMFVPLMTALSLTYFRCTTGPAKGLALLSLCLVLGVSLNNHIPSIPLLFFLIFFFSYGHYLGGGIKANLTQAFKRPILPWTIASVILVLGLAMPVLALNIELRTDPEMFGSLRLLNSNSGSLNSFFASELPDSSVFFSNQMSRVYLTMHNVLGFLTEPIFIAQMASNPEGPPSWIVGSKSSELRIYLGLVPLAFAALALRNWRDPLVRIFVILSFITFLLTIGFDPNLNFFPHYTNPAQRIAFLLLPGTGLIEALQNTVALFSFTLIVLAALGWQKTSGRLRSIIVGSALVLVGGKFVVLNIWESTLPYAQTRLESTELLFGLVFAASVFAVGWKTRALYVRLAAVAVMDVVLFATALSGPNIDTTLPQDLAGAQIIHGASGHTVATYRPVFPGPDRLLRPNVDTGISAPELISRMSYGFGPLVLRNLGVHSQRFGQFFMTRSYYDFMANVAPEKQLLASGVTAPVLQFFADENAVVVEDARAAAVAINALPRAGLKDILLVEKLDATTRLIMSDEDVAKQFIVKQTVTPANVSRNRYLAAQDIYAQSHWKRPLYPGAQITPIVTDYNSLTLTVNAPVAGWLYWADGYSRHWRASVNNAPADIEKANINFKAVHVPAGTSTVNFTYDPVLIRWSYYVYFSALVFYVIVGGVFAFKARLHRALFAKSTA